MTKNSRDMLISLLALAVIVFGIRYHVMRERLRHADLHSWYQQQNAANFGGRLQDASVEWGSRTGTLTIHLRLSLTETQTHQEAKLAKLQDHDACHVATWEEEPKHGPKWQALIGSK
jgi:hypothetical protein